MIEVRHLSFRDYVTNHSPEDSSVGDCIRELKMHAQKLPPETTFSELNNWLVAQLASESMIEAAKSLWERYQFVMNPIRVETGFGLTVAQLIELLQAENPAAEIIKFHPASASKASRVLSFSRVTVEDGGRYRPAIMFE